MVIDSEGNILVIGQSHGIGTHWDYATIKYTPAGDSIWVRRYNGPCSSFPGDYPYAVTVDDEDNVYVTGWSDGEGNCNPQCFTIAYSSNGNTLWEHRYPAVGYAGYDVLYGDGYIYVVASSYSFGVYILKYDKHGNLVGSFFAFPHGSSVHPAQLASDIAGNIYISSVKNLNFTVLKITSSGAVIWEYQYPGASNPGSFPRMMTVDKNNNVYLTGETIGWVCPGGDYDYLTIKISQDKVSIDPQSEIITQFELFQNYPNPFNPETTIRFALPKKEFVELKLYDMLGREVRTLLSEDRVAGTHSITFNAEGLASGVYYYGITAGEFSESRKLILLK